MITMTRRLTFSAAHADWLANRSLEENTALFGAHASPEPYGHNYVLDVSVRGKIVPETGVLVNIKEIDRIVREQIVQTYDHIFINRSVPAFADRPVTPENLTATFAAVLAPHMPTAVTLSGLRLEATPARWVEWQAQNSHRAEENETMRVTHAYEFAASHRLHSPCLSDAENRELFGKCNYPNGHGHNYLLEVTLEGPVDPRTGRVIRPELLDAIVQREILDRYDHRHFNYDIPEFEGLVPSAEIITQVIWKRLRDQFSAPVALYRVLVRETARNIFEMTREDEDDQ